jgi:hypothetical protein
LQRGKAPLPLLRGAGQAAYDDGDDAKDYGGYAQELPGPAPLLGPALQAEEVAQGAQDDAGELYGDAVDQEEADQRAKETEDTEHYPDSRTQSLLASFRGEAVDPLVGLGAGHVSERLAEAILQALDAVLAPPLDGQRLE